VLDEPTNGLDPQGMREVRLLLRRLADSGTTVFVSSHLLAEVEAMCDRVGVLARGRLLADGPPAALRRDTEHLTVEVDDRARAARLLRSRSMLRVELGKAAHRIRTVVLGTGLAALAIIPVIVLATTSAAADQGGPAFFSLIRHSGLIAAIAAITLVQPFFLPL